MSRYRRTSDRWAGRLFVIRGEAGERPGPIEAPAGAVGVETHRITGGAASQEVAREADAAVPEPTVVLVDDGIGTPWMIAGTEVHRLPRGLTPEAVLERAVVLGREYVRRELARRQASALPEALVTFARVLGEASGAVDAAQVLAEHALAMVGGRMVLVYAREDRGERLLPVAWAPSVPGFAPEPLADSSGLRGAGVITAVEAAVRAPGASALVDGLNAAWLAHLAVGEARVLLLAESRRDRVLHDHEWAILRVLATQAESTIRRLELFDEVRSLSLTDELTGASNRRHMSLTLQHGLVAAERDGAPLAVVLVDLHNFKEYNDRYGHVAGDRLLREVAECLRGEARGSDIVARYGGDEFLVILPGGTAAGAAAYVRRVEQRLEGRVGFASGIAEYGPGARTVEQLIEAADRQLYRLKPGLPRG
jgi:diguanylate cyclase (GGDEF)-like protein